MGSSQGIGGLKGFFVWGGEFLGGGRGKEKEGELFPNFFQINNLYCRFAFAWECSFFFFFFVPLVFFFLCMLKEQKKTTQRKIKTNKQTKTKQKVNKQTKKKTQLMPTSWGLEKTQVGTNTLKITHKVGTT